MHSRTDLECTEVSVFPNSVTFRGGAAIATVLLLARALFVGDAAFAKDVDNCQRINASEFMSPDSRWVAHLYGKVCDLGISSSAAVLVDLARVGSSAGPTVVLSIDMPSQDSQWPKPEWESSQSLAIQLSANSRIALRMAEFQNVTIQVRFCPGDPAVRDRWLAYGKSYRKWVDDMAAWSRALKSDPNREDPRPIPPKPPDGPKPESSCVP